MWSSSLWRVFYQRGSRNYRSPTLSSCIQAQALAASSSCPLQVNCSAKLTSCGTLFCLLSSGVGITIKLANRLHENDVDFWNLRTAGTQSHFLRLSSVYQGRKQLATIFWATVFKAVGFVLILLQSEWYTLFPVTAVPHEPELFSPL